MVDNMDSYLKLAAGLGLMARRGLLHSKGTGPGHGAVGTRLGVGNRCKLGSRWLVRLWSQFGEQGLRPQQDAKQSTTRGAAWVLGAGSGRRRGLTASMLALWARTQWQWRGQQRTWWWQALHDSVNACTQPRAPFPLELSISLKYFARSMWECNFFLHIKRRHVYIVYLRFNYRFNLSLINSY